MRCFIKTIYTIRIKKVFVGRRIKELERVYGIREGRPEKKYEQCTKFYPRRFIINIS